MCVCVCVCLCVFVCVCVCRVKRDPPLWYPRQLLSRRQLAHAQKQSVELRCLPRSSLRMLSCSRQCRLQLRWLWPINGLSTMETTQLHRTTTQTMRQSRFAELIACCSCLVQESSASCKAVPFNALSYRLRAACALLDDLSTESSVRLACFACECGNATSRSIFKPALCELLGTAMWSREIAAHASHEHTPSYVAELLRLTSTSLPPIPQSRTNLHSLVIFLSGLIVHVVRPYC